MGYARSWIRLQVGFLGIFALGARAAGRRRARRVSAVGVLGAQAAGRRCARRVRAVGVLGARAAGPRLAVRGWKPLFDASTYRLNPLVSGHWC